jgi:nitroimidazol reductase NimA-like FMN-containing flavoprotein (pyridoxamine 5'-phosphate oxidase superfamily)
MRKLFADLPAVSVATVDRRGQPHVVPLWFVWPEDAVYVSTRRDGRTWANARNDRRVALSIDVGRSWVELAGVMVEGKAELLAPDDALMRGPISAWHEKYRSLLAGDGFQMFADEVRELGFLRVAPERLIGWDHARD